MIGEVPSADGVPVRYEVVGSGVPAVVLVHGWSCDRSYWRHQVEHLASRCTVVTVDLAGHGESGCGRPAWTMASFGADVVAVMDELDLRQAVLVGHSMGGDVVVEAGRRRRERLLGLVWVDTYPTLDVPESKQAVLEAATFLAPFREDFVAATDAFVRALFPVQADPDLVNWVAADMAAAPREIALDAMQHAITNGASAITGLREAAVPAVAVNGRWRPTDAESLARHGVRTVLMPEVGHFPMMEDPARFNRLLDDAIDQFAARRPES